MAKPYRPKRWRLAISDPAACWLLSSELGVSPVAAQVLYNRGLTLPAPAHAFLTAGRDQILDPFRLKDMDRAVALIRARIAERRPIMIYGDYDVDGVTGTTILVLALRALGATVDYYIPNRFNEGYGLNVAALQEIKGRGHDFVISVDTGVSAVEEARAAREMGMTLIISDHHEPGPALPDVPACINPKRADCSYPFKELSGVGVAFKLALALETPGVWNLLDIVTLGTIADMVALVGENRAIVREGLNALSGTRRPGLVALLEVSGVQQPVTATHIGYLLGPRINALGRMGSAMAAVELLTTEDPGRARTLAKHLDDENKSRQEVEAAILQEALAQASQLTPAEKSHVLVLAGEGWHHGVVGICASRVLEAYYRPSIMLSIDGDVVRGSARSIPGFHMFRALSQVSDLFAKFGGHAMAAGMTLKRREDVAVLRARLNEIGARWLRPEDLVPELMVDAYVELEQVSDKLLEELGRLEPYGIGNPSPVLAARDVAVIDSRTMGREQQHLKLMVEGPAGAARMEAVGWNMAPARPGLGSRVQVAFCPERDTYLGRNRLRLTLKDVQAGGAGADAIIAPPELPVDACLKWDPLAGLGRPKTVRPRFVADARGDRVESALAPLNPLQEPEAAAATESDDAPAVAQPPRLRYLAALAALGAGPILVWTASPWAAARLYDELLALLPDRRDDLQLWQPGRPEPRESLLTVAPYGMAAGGTYAHTVLYHPPYHEGQVPGGNVHLLWEAGDWDLAGAALGWPYPKREALVELYKLLKRGEVTPAQLAGVLGEVPGVWSRLRLESGIAIFRELRLVGPEGRPVTTNGVKFELEASARFRQGLDGRAALERLRANDWPACAERL
ncbi:MAG TPA: single-stranded-DNA-specific exonuclease RecJ [Symbiobacteriaceae bacterium]